ncbi:hypothetical protein O181_125526 [Austropuccinia psidii MF-1]|uniref:Uncharacterized protein n=1 Tax=Austropuccinia psidii MF-1 TaxID=1389203 RepID=A0A9Q3KSI7_9BASI|nr:hypothetical protein [Austropuccinia psidii MF-1]
MKDGDGEWTLELGTIVTMSCHQWDSNAKNKNPQIPQTRLSRSYFSSRANPAATHSRAEWNLMVRGIIRQTLPNRRATYSWPESILPTT